MPRPISFGLLTREQPDGPLHLDACADLCMGFYEFIAFGYCTRSPRVLLPRPPCGVGQPRGAGGILSAVSRLPMMRLHAQTRILEVVSVLHVRRGRSSFRIFVLCLTREASRARLGLGHVDMGGSLRP